MASPVSRWTIIADDLTGAADAAASFAPFCATSVHVDSESAWPDLDVVAVNTESRYLDPSAAAALVSHATATALRGGGSRVFKKVDSLLRGNIGPEIGAMLDVHRERGKAAMAVVAPAYPATGRTTVDGALRVEGTTNDEATISDLLHRGRVSCQVVRRQEYGGTVSLARTLFRLRMDGVDAAIVDAESENDLATIAGALAVTRDWSIPVGSGGLAAEIARLEFDGVPAHPLEFETTPSGVLVVVGSFSETARRQVKELAAAGIAHIALDHLHLGSGATIEALRRALRTGPAMLTPDPLADVARHRAQEIATALADVCLGAAAESATLVVVGGETLRAVLDTLQVSELRVVGELAPGVVVSELAGTTRRLITKAGAFGEDRAVLSVLERLNALG
jgi:uncharacterized protein YgbK (DUF1537 family)